MDQQIKERMVGAGVLVLAAVIFIPMLLSGPPPQRGDSSSRAGGEPGHELGGPPSADAARSADGSGFSSRIVPLGAPASGRSIAEQAARPAAREATPSPPAKALAKSSPQRDLDVSQFAKLEPQSRTQAESKPNTKPPAAAKEVRKAIAAPPTTAAAAGWVVQLGSFASSRNAHALRDRLKAKGYKAFARSSGTGAQAVTRVYVGPDASRERAQRRVTRLLAETRLQGIVIRNPH